MSGRHPAQPGVDCGNCINGAACIDDAACDIFEREDKMTKIETGKNHASDHPVRVEYDTTQSGGPMLRVVDDHNTICATVAFCTDGVLIHDSDGDRLEPSVPNVAAMQHTGVTVIESRDGKFTAQWGGPGDKMTCGCLMIDSDGPNTPLRVSCCHPDVLEAQRAATAKE